jgi:signal transduction histidine kinase
MEKALHEIERVERLVSSLLTYAAPPRTSLRQADINRIVQDTLLFFRRPCENQGVTLESRLEEMAPFEIDVEKIRQALFNLLKNALEALEDGGTITVSTNRRGTDACITVSDTGPGIPEDELPLLFEPFFTRKGSGTGLGLSITQRIVDEHHGTITVSTSPGTGSSFTISLPITGQSGT